MFLNKKFFTRILISTLGLGVLFSSSLFAQPAPQDNTKAQKERIDITEFDKKSTLVQENFKKMQEQIDIMRVTKDPQVRQKLIEEHWTTMQANNNLMGGMWGRGMMGCCGGSGYWMNGGHMMGWGGMGGYYSKLTSEELKQRQYMTDQYMNMQQNMMNQMMQQNYMMINPGR
ncbi:hypothetical protein PSHI8_23740 [Polynucleobacter sp. SHI8]|uniref:hypothetical protein n=1 Tax=unclassified Polynucleobacter TaxID=2640945 RepID=UPI002492C212|nr:MULTISPECIES: hypothetical protein [unclassified Polynucleobacter]BDW12290.1 hypothetical protein PSHI2_23720 [Polynucleobacter sp. SHI2]BDW14738.1 hypothetical protein PSHI8_23740 [Polynucleobacter sp. SHI8]